MNNNDTGRILDELYKIDPSLRKHEEMLESIIPTLPGIKPDVEIDHAFVVRLRHKLLRVHTRQTLSSIWLTFSPVFLRRPVLNALGIILVVGGVAFIIGHGNDRMLRVAIDPIGARAYGSLAQAPSVSKFGGKNGGVDAALSISPTPTPKMMFGLGGGGPAVDVPADMYPVTNYVYGGDAFTIPEAGLVYKRVADASAGAKLVGSLRGMNFGVDTGSFSGLKVRNIEIAEDKDYGYAVNLYVPQGSISINANWEQWHMDKRQFNNLAESDIPSDETLRTVADAFFSKHHINTANYGAPVFDESWRDVPAMLTPDGVKAPSYVPDSLLITYPLIIDGMPVYESWGMPSGLQVIVDIRELKVTSVNGLGTLDYEASPYALESDAQKIKDLAVTGGAQQPYPMGFASVSSPSVITVMLDTPKLVLMKYYRDPNSRNEELLVPALRFPVRDRKPGAPDAPYIMVPIVKDIVDGLIAPSELPLRVGEEGNMLGVTIKPTELLEDSRCPADVACIQAGTVRVNTTLTGGMGTAPQIFALNKPVTTETEEITLVNVLPSKKDGTEILPADYTFVFAVRKR